MTETNGSITSVTDSQMNSQQTPNANNVTDMSTQSTNLQNNPPISMIPPQQVLTSMATPLQGQNSEETFINNNPQYANFPPSGNFAIQAAATLTNQHRQAVQHNISKNKKLKSKGLNLNMNQVLTSITQFQSFPPFNIAQPNVLTGNLAYVNKKAISRHKFSIDEDNLLRHLVNEHGTTNWRFIADNMEGRSPRQCRDRWKNYLQPGIKNAPWTPEEDLLLEEKFAALGSQWSRIAKFFPNRTDINVKNRWATRNGRVNKAQPIIDMRNIQPVTEEMKAKSPTPSVDSFPLQKRTLSAEIGGAPLISKQTNEEEGGEVDQK